MAAGAAAAAERGLLRLLQRLEAKAKAKEVEKDEGNEGNNEGDEGDLKDVKDGKEDVKEEARLARVARQERRLELRQLVAELEDLSKVWLGRDDLVQRLGGLLGGSQCAHGVRAFAPLAEDVKQRMVAATSAFNAWLAQLHAAQQLEQLLPQAGPQLELLSAVQEPLEQLLGVPYMQSCYRWVGDLQLRVRFLFASCLVFCVLSKKLSEKKSTSKEIKEKETSKESSLSASKSLESLESSLQRLRDFFGDVEPWLLGRLARYDRAWRGAAAQATARGFGQELRRCLGRAIEAQGSDLELMAEPEEKEVKKKEEEVKKDEEDVKEKEEVKEEKETKEVKDEEKETTSKESSKTFEMVFKGTSQATALTEALRSFAAEYLDATLAETPERGLGVEALLQVLLDLEEPFEVGFEAFGKEMMKNVGKSKWKMIEMHEILIEMTTFFKKEGEIKGK